MAVALAADIATRAWVTARLSGGRDITAGSLLRLRLVINHGASPGLAAGAGLLIAVAGWLWHRRVTPQPQRPVAG